MKLITIVVLLCLSISATSQVFSFEKLSDCLINNWNTDSLLKKNNFKTVYDRPRKESGFLALFHHPSKQEYLFSYSSEKLLVEQFIYYLPTKKQYDTFLETKAKNENIEVEGMGRVYYEDGKKYYQIAVRRR